MEKTPIAINGALKGVARHTVRLVSHFLFPPACAACGRLSAQANALCPQCWTGVRFIERPYCEVLGTPFSHDLGDGILSADAIANPPPFDRLRAAVAYSGPARSIVQNLKYRDRLELATMMAGWMMRAAGDAVRDADFIIPVPLHRSRFFVRQFNQSAELARALSQLSGTPMAVHELIRKRRTSQQVGLGLRQREENVRGAFALSDEGRMRFAGKKLVLVDDVYTTGATVSACTRALRRAKPQDISVVTFAMALPETIS
ncbi:ComF family protein [Rhizobium sp. L1K21]|uniref:ComF family protein n=1 Tax=Rhizobium sp. L1K21 TaxID=2954933 RepID=UPI0020935864|nr:ComF family protein [Rhizobium sp. L1K21]MCO6188202.1 ComF family protein [Rhizobium sp. L1K21]